MGHLHLLLDEMGLDEMGLDEMGINLSNPTKTPCTVGATFSPTLNAHVGLTLLVGVELFRANVYV